MIHLDSAIIANKTNHVLEIYLTDQKLVRFDSFVGNEHVINGLFSTVHVANKSKKYNGRPITLNPGSTGYFQIDADQEYLTLRYIDPHLGRHTERIIPFT